MPLTENAPLDRLNTFGVAARTRWLARVDALSDLPAAINDPRVVGLPLLVLGDGSNVLLTRDWPGLVLSIAAARVSHDVGADGRHHVRAEAGFGWNALVEWTLARGIGGLENLVSIPGRVGAAPIQNIGAYGVELDQFVDAVEVYDLIDARFARLPRAECCFGYRDSRFKSAAERDRYIVCAVEFVMPSARVLRLDYPGVREELAAMGADRPRPSDVARAIAALRRRKLPDPAVLGNAGSFFKNPIVPRQRAADLAARHPGLPVHPAGSDQAKLSAAWLIEASGMKGHRVGDAAVSAQHALVLVNHGKASGADLWQVANQVMSAVQASFGIELEPEPRII